MHARTRVRVVRLEREVADYHLRQAALRGQGPETVKVGVYVCTGGREGGQWVVSVLFWVGDW
jgi:hypothetical protein